MKLPCQEDGWKKVDFLGEEGDWKPPFEFCDGESTHEEMVAQLLRVCALIEAGVFQLDEPWASLRRAMNEAQIHGWEEQEDGSWVHGVPALDL